MYNCGGACVAVLSVCVCITSVIFAACACMAVLCVCMGWYGCASGACMDLVYVHECGMCVHGLVCAHGVVCVWGGGPRAAQ